MGSPMIERFISSVELGIVYLRTALAIVVGTLIFGVFFCVSANVFGRYVLNSSYDWAGAMSRFFFIWAVLLGGGVACLRNGNIAIAFIKDSVPRLVATLFELIIIAVVYGICVVIFIAYRELVSGYVSSTPLLGIPKTYLYIAMVVFAAAMFIANTAELLRLMARATRST